MANTNQIYDTGFIFMNENSKETTPNFVQIFRRKEDSISSPSRNKTKDNKNKEQNNVKYYGSKEQNNVKYNGSKEQNNVKYDERKNSESLNTFNKFSLLSIN